MYKPVELNEMLLAREKRVYLQNKLIEKYQKPIISLTLNIPGPIKASDEIHKIFIAAKNRIQEALEKNDISVIYDLELLENTGFEWLLSVDSSAVKIKKITTKLEDMDSLGRLLDIDVIDINGEKISREDIGEGYRKCLLCNNQAQVCARNRTHTVAELLEKINEISKGANL